MGDMENSKVCKIDLTGRIDSNNAPQMEESIMGQLAECKPESVILDASDLEYISSAGLRVLLRVKKTYADMRIVNVNSEVYEILDMTGFTEMLQVEKAYRVISVEGCEVIGEGANGKVYRVDQDNVVKTYKNADALADIQHEREVARLALILGVPTAISYDVVKVGDSYGSVFELLNSRSFAKILAEEPEKMDWCVKEYVDLIKKLHAIDVPEGKLPSRKTYIFEKYDRMKSCLPDAAAEKLRTLLEGIPEQNTMLHGDYHTKNIVLAGDEVLLIDMDTLSVGHPILELAQMYNSYIGFSEYDHENVKAFQGFDQETATTFWRRSLMAYLGTENWDEAETIEKKIRCVSYTMLISWRTKKENWDSVEDPELDLWKSQLLALLDQVDSLPF